MKATALRATKATRVSDAATIDPLVGPGDGIVGYKRLDVATSRASDGHLRVQIDVTCPAPW
jgi:hypothetical protein